MVIETALIVAPKAFPLILTFLGRFARKFKGFKTSATVTINNKHREMKLTDPEIFSPGEIDNPLDWTINPGEIQKSSKFFAKLGKFTSQGMISYNIFGQVGPNEKPLYLIVTWKVKLNGGGNSLGIDVLEYDEPPLKYKTLDEMYDLYKELHKRNAGRKVWPTYNNGAFFSIGGTIDTKYVYVTLSILKVND
ncbi:hypothetical protein GLOIN_2v1557793 [Rhizophagus clarus]|uniref:Uncharacterized protein n=1 Tax=Rhizophagus clarus TaxID=94130 RepID=A0A8H3LDB2_9GLOM|nr:hypothetical protein GLOIN_2v1557793 [Rhizophagus clarus]